MKKLFLTLAVLLGSVVSNAQTNQYTNTLDWVIETFAANDAGFQYIIDQKGEDDYLRFTNGIKEEIAKVNNEDDCVKVIGKWLSYFRKGHIEFGLKSKPAYLEKEEMRKNNNCIVDSLYAEKLSDKTFYLRIPSFDYLQKEDIDKLIEENDNQIQGCANLIIDLRNGTGGSDASFQNLMKYIYTNPIRSYGIKLKASELNAKGFDEYADKLNNPKLKDIAERLRVNKGNFISPSDNSKNVSSIELKEVLKNPQHVAIVINERNVSSDEQFLFYTKQSLKVKLFGRPTAGAIDISNMTVAFSEDDKYYLSYAMSRSARAEYMTIDNIGIQPDYLIDDEVGADKWIDYVQNILEY